MAEHAWDQMAAAAQANRDFAVQAKKGLQEDFRRRLLSIVTTKIRTSFIGAIDKIEKRFGHLWGHRLNPDECTPEQLAVRPLWDALRTEILNNGNTQLRAAQSEFEQYTIVWNRYLVSANKEKE